MQRRMIASILLAASLALSSSAIGQAKLAFEDGMAAYRTGKHAVAFVIFRELAENGHARAQGVLGLMLAQGIGTRVDPVASVRWYRAAAQQGDALGASGLGLAYELGTGGAGKDEAEAARWYRAAADKNQIDAMRNLADLHLEGRGVPLDEDAAYKLMRRAATAGDAKAQFRLGLMTSWGKGTAKNWNLALHWILLAADNGHAHAINALQTSQLDGMSLEPCDRISLESDRPLCRVATLRYVLFRNELLARGIHHHLPEASKKQYLGAFNSWLRDRSTKCQLLGLSSDLETMIDQIKDDNEKSACAIREGIAYNHRYSQLAYATDKVETEDFDKIVKAAVTKYLHMDVGVIKEIVTRARRLHGKWYFEVRLDHTKLQQIDLAQVRFGFSSPEMRVGRFSSLHSRDSDSAIEVQGLAIDLDNGKYYRHVNGRWQSAPPSGGDGVPIKQKQPFRAFVESDQDLTKALETEALTVNFGLRRFEFPPPAGYRPLLN